MAIKLTDVTDMVGITNTRAKEPTLPVKPTFDPEKEGDRKVLHSWETVTRTQAPIKSAPKINRSFVIIGAVIALLLVAMKEFMLIAVVASIIFMRYVLSATPARSVRHTISNHGIDYSGQFYGWNALTKFFIKSIDGTDMLCVDTVDRLPGRLYLLLRSGDREKVKEIVGRYLTFLEEEPKTFADRIYDSATSRISTDK